MRNLKFLVAVSIGLGGLSALAESPRPILPPREVAPPQPVKPLDDAPKTNPPATVAPRAGENGALAEKQPFSLPLGAIQKDLKEEGDIRNAFVAVTEGALGRDAC